MSYVTSDMRSVAAKFVREHQADDDGDAIKALLDLIRSQRAEALEAAAFLIDQANGRVTARGQWLRKRAEKERSGR